MKLRLLSAFLTFSVVLFGATSTAWEVSGFNDFLKGRLSGLTLFGDGSLQLGPSADWNTALGQPALWKIAVGPDGSTYAATGHTGKVFKLSPDGKSTLLWSAEQSEVFALCVGRGGDVFVGTSPQGGVYRLVNGKAEEVWRAPAKYIWALEAYPDGSLYIATGEPGRVYRYDGKRTELYYETGQPNVTALGMGPNGHVYAGTDPNGLLYDIAAVNKASVLYDSSLPEIRSIVVDPQGVVYAAAMGGAVASRSPGSSPAAAAATPTAIATTPTVITVTEAKENSSSPADEQSTKTADPTRGATAMSSSTPTTSNSAVVEVSGVEKSAIYRIKPNGAVDNLRSSKDDNVYALLLDGSSLLFSTDDHGRVYRLADGKFNLAADLGSGETTSLAAGAGKIFAGLSNPGRLVALGTAGSGPGSYESLVHDCTSVARWGHLQWYGSKTGVSFRTRTGFSARPDGTWSPWSAPIQDPDTALIQSPPARFIQFRAEWTAGSSARIYTIDLPYLPQNSSPAVHSITVSAVVGTNPVKSGAAAASSTAAYSITVTDTGAAAAASSTTTSTQSVARLQATQAQISWQADDPDGDKLAYSVYFRAEEAGEWQLIRSKISENSLLLDPDVFADGRYFFKVVATDSPSNTPEFARQTELVSAPILIDSTPPVVTVGTPRRDGAAVEIEIEARDQTSPLRLCEYSLDAGAWQPVESIDGITDSPRERFRLRLQSLRPGEHLLVFRVYDAANNAGLGKVVLR